MSPPRSCSARFFDLDLTVSDYPNSMICHSLRAAAAITSNAVIASLASTAKPSFLVWDRVYQKIASAEEEKWLLRASEMTLASVQTQLLKNEVLRYAFSSEFLTPVTYSLDTGCSSAQSLSTLL
jgi:hypothetical protein